MVTNDLSRFTKFTCCLVSDINKVSPVLGTDGLPGPCYDTLVTLIRFQKQ
jgi:hypothetical protein